MRAILMQIQIFIQEELVTQPQKKSRRGYHIVQNVPSHLNKTTSVDEQNKWGTVLG
jgi:hypothetical protein